MKIIYTQKKSKPPMHKKVILTFECLLLVFVMSFFGMLLTRQRLNELENRYESANLLHNEAVKDAVELIIPQEEQENG